MMVLETRAIGDRSPGSIRQAVVQIRMRDERTGRPEQQHVIVVRVDERGDGDEGVAAGPVFDDHRLAPALAEPVGQQAGADIGAAAGAERHDELDRPGRPFGFRRGSGGESADGDKTGDRQRTASF